MSVIVTTITAFVNNNFDQAAKDFKTTPSGINWTDLRAAMLVLQYWANLSPTDKLRVAEELGPVSIADLHLILINKAKKEWERVTETQFNIGE